MAQPGAVIKVGYEQFVPPRVPPGMWFDRDTWLILPLGVRPAAKGRVAASWFWVWACSSPPSGSVTSPGRS